MRPTTATAVDECGVGGGCPVLVITGLARQCQKPRARPDRLAEITGGELVVIEGGGHLPQARDPVKVNLLLRDFVRRVG